MDEFAASLPKRMSRWLSERECTDMREMMTHLQKYQASHQDSERKSNTTTGSQKKREPPKTNAWSKKTFREQRPAPTKADLDKITCFKCHKKGHYARECRQPEAFVVEEELRPLSKF